MDNKIITAQREYNRRYRSQNRTRINEYHRKWVRENADKVAEYKKNFYLKKLQQMEGASNE